MVGPALLAAALMGCVALLAMLLRPRSGRWAGEDVSACAAGRIEPLLAQIAQIDHDRAHLHRAVEEAIPPGPRTAPAHAAPGVEEVAAAYETVRERLLDLVRVDLLGTPLPASTRFTELIRGLADGIDEHDDPHLGELVAVGARLNALGLGRADLEPLGVTPFETAARSYVLAGRRRAADRRTALVAHLEAAGTALRGGQAAAATEAATASAGDDLRAVIRDLRRAVVDHLDTLRPLLAPRRRDRAGPVLTRRDRTLLTERLTVAVQQLSAADAPAADAPIVALRALVALRLPCAAGRPFFGFIAAGDAVVAGLRVCARRRAADLARRRVQAAAALDRHVADLGDAVSTDARLRRAECDVAWRRALEVADRSVLDTARALLERPTPRPLAAVADAAGVVLVGDRAAGHLTREVRNVVPSPPRRDAAPEALRHGIDRLVTMDRNAGALAGIDAVLMGLLLAGDGGTAPAEMGRCVAVLAGLPPHLARAAGDLGAYRSGPDVGGGLRRAVGEVGDGGEVGNFGEQVLHDVLPHLPAPGADTGLVDLAVTLHAGLARCSPVGERVLGGSPAVVALPGVRGRGAGSLRGLQRATEAFGEAGAEQDGAADVLGAAFTASVTARLRSGHDRCARLPEAPRPPDVAEALVGLHTAFRGYRARADGVLAAAARIPHATLDHGRVDAARADLARADATLAAVAAGRSPTVALAGIGVPFPPGWGAGRELHDRCAASTALLRIRAAEHRRRLAQWVHAVDEVVQQTRLGVLALLEHDIATLPGGHRTVPEQHDRAAHEVLLHASAQTPSSPPE